MFPMMHGGGFGGRWGRQQHMGGRRPQNMMLMALLMQVMQIGVDNIPPVTLAVLALCVANFLNLTPLGQPSHLACFSVVDFLYRSRTRIPLPASLMRLFVLSPLNHLDDYHLYYNMLSWLYKGRLYEQAKGTPVMAVFILLTTFGVGVVYVILSVFIITFTDPSWFGEMLASWLSPKSCVVGLSGVLFAVKTVIHGMEDPQAPHVFQGLMRTEAQYVVWLELIWIQMFLPQQVAFLGHLAGILWGLLYLKLELEEKYVRPLAARIVDGLRHR